jgi:hypothetical protein
MTQCRRCRLNADTFAITVEEGKETAFQIPVGAEILVFDMLPSAEPNARVEVHWKGKVFTMFAVDIRERAERIDSAHR